MWEMLHREKERTGQKAQERGQHRLPAAGSTKQIRPPARACRALPSSHSKNEEQPIRSSRPSKLNERPCMLGRETPAHCSSSMGQTKMAPSSKSYTRGKKYGPCIHVVTNWSWPCIQSSKLKEDRGYIIPATICPMHSVRGHAFSPSSMQRRGNGQKKVAPSAKSHVRPSA
ncbi:hypothetical protein D5086_031878 [Populus alba]|uniref:Uncharacterized protein n=1 Tax=Populus alba TaxID=43335 RepID=A0ACC4AKQ8_POPAL